LSTCSLIGPRHTGSLQTYHNTHALIYIIRGDFYIRVNFPSNTKIFEESSMASPILSLKIFFKLITLINEVSGICRLKLFIEINPDINALVINIRETDSINHSIFHFGLFDIKLCIIETQLFNRSNSIFHNGAFEFIESLK